MTGQVETKRKSRLSPGYKVRLLEDSDIDAADDLWTLAFGNGFARGHFYRDMDRIYGAFKGKDLHAVAGVIDYKMSLSGKTADCGGIAAVATMPGQRYQNLVNVLIVEALREMHDRKFAFSGLYPFSYPFYEKMGYAATHWRYVLEASIDWLKQRAKTGNPKEFRMLAVDEFDPVIEVYDKWFKQMNLNVNRSESKFRSILLYPGRDWRVFAKDDAYVIMDNKHSDRENGLLEVPEFVYLNEQAYVDGLALIGQMDSQFKTVKWIDWDVELLLQGGVPHPRPKFVREPQMMTRVVNVQAFEKLLPKPLGLKLSDPLEISGSIKGDIGVGEVIQLVTGFFTREDKRFPQLHGICADRPAFCIERY